MARPVREELTATQVKAISMLITKDITGKTNEDIAEELGINIVTLYRWKRTKQFNDKLVEEADELQRSFLGDAYCQLRSIINNPRTNATSKLKGIEMVLKSQGRLKDVQESKVDVTVTTNAEDVLERLGID